jgi:zinc/manganese transport system permease protein
MMWDMLALPFVQLALVAAFVLAGIHTYLGFHVVSRGVIFVDLSMAQAAAFGTVVASVVGFGEDAAVRYVISLLFTLLAALLISIARTKDERVPQEAFIGIIYGAFSAGAILLLSRRPEGAGELNHLLSGSLLTVQPSQLLKITLLYAVIGLFYWLFRERFFTISEDRQRAVRKNWRVGFWDFLFYGTFGIVVTSSVEIAGVLLVFALLVIPPVVAVLFTQKRRNRLIVGWAVGFVSALFGVLLSLKFDLPISPSIIMAMAGCLILSTLVLAVMRCAVARGIFRQK